MEIKKVGVLGCGLMGAGIAQVSATAGFETVVKEVSDDLISRARPAGEPVRTPMVSALGWARR